MGLAWPLSTWPSYLIIPFKYSLDCSLCLCCIVKTMICPLYIRLGLFGIQKLLLEDFLDKFISLNKKTTPLSWRSLKKKMDENPKKKICRGPPESDRSIYVHHYGPLKCQNEAQWKFLWLTSPGGQTSTRSRGSCYWRTNVWTWLSPMLKQPWEDGSPSSVI